MKCIFPKSDAPFLLANPKHCTADSCIATERSNSCCWLLVLLERVIHSKKYIFRRKCFLLACCRRFVKSKNWGLFFKTQRRRLSCPKQAAICMRWFTRKKFAQIQNLLIQSTMLEEEYLKWDQLYRSGIFITSKRFGNVLPLLKYNTTNGRLCFFSLSFLPAYQFLSMLFILFFSLLQKAQFKLT